MRTFNKIFMVGHLAADPQTRQTTSGKLLTTFALATSEISLQNNQKIQQTDFHRVTTWAHTAEICQKYLSKGSAVFLEGKIRNRSYINQNGEKKYISEIVAHNINILTWPKQINSLKEDQKVQSAD